MKASVKDLKVILKEEKKRKPRDSKRIKELDNLIQGFEASISGKYN